MSDVIVGRWSLLDLIAKGGSGSVWRAWDAKTQRLCAAKVLRQRDSADLMRFVREKGVSFDHPHLLTPYGWGAEDEHVVIAMPLVSGGTLDLLVRARGPLAEPTTVVILDQLLDGLGMVHAGGWIHRDVKPANLMFEATGSGRPHTRLADFGIAVHETDVRFTHVGMVNGTPGYMAPELFSLADPEPSHDIYAAGVVALSALNGRLPLHDGAFRPEELDRYLAHVSPKLGAVLRRMVAARPEDRYRSAAEVRRDLPRVPPDYPLTFADGSPFMAGNTLPPLPADAPAAAHAQLAGIPAGVPTGAPAGRLPGAEGAPGGASGAGGSPAARTPTTGGLPDFGRGGQAPFASAGPARGGPAPGGPVPGNPVPGNPSPGGTGSAGGSGAAGRSAAGSAAIGPGSSRRRTLIAGALGVLAALVLGAVVAVLVVRALVPLGALGGGDEGTTGAASASATGAASTGAASTGTASTASGSPGPTVAVPQVSPGQACTAQDRGLIGITADGAYLSCRPDAAGTLTYS